MPTSFSQSYLERVSQVANLTSSQDIEQMVKALCEIRDRAGRVFVVGLGGSAGNASHFVNDLRKLTGTEAYCPTDNVSEITARINDDGWGNAFVGWLEASRFNEQDALFVLSVGGGDLQREVSLEIVSAIDLAKSLGAVVLGIVGRDGGHTSAEGDFVVVVPTVDPSLVTALSEAFQSVVWHGIVTHPSLALHPPHWESLQDGQGRL